MKNLNVTTSEVNHAKEGPIRTFLNKYKKNEPSSLAECAEGKKLEELGLVDKVATAIRKTYVDSLRGEIFETVSNRNLAFAFAEEMDALVRKMVGE